jgi:hypothetical protein
MLFTIDALEHKNQNIMTNTVNSIIWNVNAPENWTINNLSIPHEFKLVSQAINYNLIIIHLTVLFYLH